LVETPAPVHVRVGGDEKVLHARIKRWYQPRLTAKTWAMYKDLFNVTSKAKLGYYMTAAKEGEKEDVRASLVRLISSSGLKDATDRAELILSGATVVLTDAFIEKASATASEAGNSDMNKAAGLFDLDIRVSDEGRLRLWQYSKLHPHDQLLLVSNGVAIAAPRIRHELVGSDLTIDRMADEGLLRQAVDTINNKK
jgi:hypothetical protein